MADSGGMPWFLWSRRGPTTERREVSPTTENVIPVLHALALALAVGAGLLVLTVLAACWVREWRSYAISLTRFVAVLILGVGGFMVPFCNRRVWPLTAVAWLLAIISWFAWRPIATGNWLHFAMIVSCMGLGFEFGAALLTAQAKRELIHPLRPIPPQTEAQLKWLAIEEQKARLELWEKVLRLQREGLTVPRAVYAPLEDGELAGQLEHLAQDQNEVFKAFLQDCAVSTRREHLRDVCGWDKGYRDNARDLLVRTGWAVDRGQHGWDLLFPAGLIIQHLRDDGLHNVPQWLKETAGKDD